MSRGPAHISSSPSGDRVFTRERVREVDRLCVEQFAIPGIVLMENASRALADVAVEMLGEAAIPADRPPRVLVICGGGNNGGDGLAAARHLANRGIECTIVLTRPADSYAGDAATNLAICQRMDLPIIEAPEDPVAALAGAGPHELVLDGLLGTGLDSPVRPPLSDVIAWINRQDARVLAIDIPSGLDCDTGEPLGAAVKAEQTISFVGYKLGFLQAGADEYIGEVVIGDIGAPRSLIKSLGEARPT